MSPVTLLQHCEEGEVLVSNIIASLIYREAVFGSVESLLHSKCKQMELAKNVAHGCVPVKHATPPSYSRAAGTESVPGLQEFQSPQKDQEDGRPRRFQ